MQTIGGNLSDYEKSKKYYNKKLDSGENVRLRNLTGHETRENQAITVENTLLHSSRNQKTVMYG